VAPRQPRNGGGSGVDHYRLNPVLAEDFIEFSQRQYDCLDYDPFHPLIIHMGKGLPPEEFLWLSVYYMAFYNIGSAYAAFHGASRNKPLPAWFDKLPIGVQRRNLRGGRVRAHLESFANKAREHGGLQAFLTKGFTGDQRADWQRLKDAVQSVWGNGRWSVYTSSELYQKANKLPVWPCDVMNDGSTGPRAGLSRLYEIELPRTKEAVVTLDRLADKTFDWAKAQIKTKIPYLPKGHYDYGMLESQLCDFNSLCKGRYYVGRDIDRDQERIRAAEKALKVLGQRMSLAPVWDARAVVFSRRFLGEFSGWLGRTDYAKTYYVRTGRVADHMEILEDQRAGRFF
jgi:hypothetical protein